MHIELGPVQIHAVILEYNDISFLSVLALVAPMAEAQFMSIPMEELQPALKPPPPLYSAALHII